MRPCSVCLTSSPIAYRHPVADLYRCPQCDHCFSDASTLVQESYSPEYYEVTHRNWFRNPHTRMFTALNKLIQDAMPTARTVLDVGCGTGNFLRFLRGTGFYTDLSGIDLSPTEPCPGLEFIQGNFLSTQLTKQYDVVTSLAVIEHIADVREFARRLQAVCKPGGIILVMTLDDRSLLYSVARFLHGAGLFHGAFERLYSAHHLNHFNSSSLPLLFGQPELRKIHLEKHNTSLDAMDIPGKTLLGRSILRVGVWGIFQISQWTGHTYLQTLVLRKEG